MGNGDVRNFACETALPIGFNDQFIGDFSLDPYGAL
jgi:hypothetical protein